MCYKCANIEALVALANAADIINNVKGSEDARRAICNVITEVGNQFANDLRDERLEATTTQLGTEPKNQATDGCAGSVGDHGQADLGQTSDSKPNDPFALLMLLSALSGRGKKEGKAE